MPALLRIPAVGVVDDAVAIREVVHTVFDAIEVPPPPPTVSLETRPRDGEVPPVRIYHPEQRRHPGAALLWIHGGGFIAGSARYDDPHCARMVQDHGVPVVSVDYRLAPESPYPDALDDCFAVMSWMLGDHVAVEPGRLVVAGASAGGGLAMGLGLLARDRGVDAIGGLVCAYPMLDDRPGSPSMERLTARRTWHCGSNRVAWEAYLGGASEVPMYAAPGRADIDDLRGLPPVHIDVGTLDGFFDEDLAFAEKLARAEVAVDLVVTPGASHGSEHLNPEAPTSRRIFAARRAARERALAGICQPARDRFLCHALVVRPTLYDYAGGDAAFVRLARAHHVRCLADPELNHPFSHPGQHPQHVERLAAYWAEVFGGPPAYSSACGNHSTALAMHAGNGDMSDLSRRFVDCFVAAADDAGLPADVEFRAALRHYMEWAVEQFNAFPDGADGVRPNLPMPRWGWDGLAPD